MTRLAKGLTRVLVGPRVRDFWGLTLLVAAGAVVVGVLEKRADAGYFEGRTLLGGCLGILLPIATWSLVERAWRLVFEPSLQLAARFGANRRSSLLLFTLPLLAVCALIGSLTCALTALVAGGSSAQNAIAGVVGATSGAAYGAWFASARILSRARWIGLLALLLDWVLGFSSGVLGLFAPRGLVRSLAGGTSVAGLSGLASAGVLLLLSGLCITLALRRTPP